MSMTDQSDRRSAVLLDQHPLVLEGVQRVLSRAGVEVVGKTTSSEQALALVEEREPDLLVTEAELPDDGIDGIECLRRARSRVRDLKAIVLSASDDPHRVAAAFEAGAEAYVVKTAHPDDLASAIRQAFGHSVYLSRSPAPAPTIPREERADEPGGLTQREREILRLAAEGHSNAELAGQLWVTEQTVKFHLSNIYRKLQVSNRTEAARWAQLNGLLSGHPNGPAEA
jgi:DNA-binding NarL/FixJ family response regulator